MSVDLVIDAVSWVLVVAGSVFLIIGAVGLLRMPDVFTRMHAVSVSDTAGVALLFLAMILQAGFSLVTAKLLFILAIFFFTGPVATHALARGALSVGIEPKLFDAQGRKRAPVPFDLLEADDVPRAQRSSGFVAAEVDRHREDAKAGRGGSAAASKAAGARKRKTPSKQKTPSKPRGGGSSKR